MRGSYPYEVNAQTRFYSNPDSFKTYYDQFVKDMEAPFPDGAQYFTVQAPTYS